MSDTYLPLAEAKRAARLLALATALGGTVGPIAIGTGGLVGASMLAPEDQALATVPVTAFVIGAALASIPAALLMRQVGRRVGFVVGASVGCIGALAATVMVSLGSFYGFSVAMVLMGLANAFNQQYRFAAADASEPAFKPKAISWVLVGGIANAILGPQASIHGLGLIPGSPYAGPFLIQAGLFVLTALILLRLSVPAPVRPAVGGGGRPLTEIVLKPRFLAALSAAIASYALMSFVMTASPLAMIGHNHSHSDAQHAIQWHVLAMFGPSFFSGALIARFGKTPMVVAGLLLIAAAAVVALMGTGLFHFFTSLILLGIGWNFGFVGATAMVAEFYRPEEAFRVQAFNEFALFGTVALASFSSGKVLAGGGWEVVNWIVLPVVLGAVGLLAIESLSRSRVEKGAAG
ncbi:MFS transporter [Chthonobacter albigriseus]|uniref:MFS transporter n=1 Tax=Chthonobacter albigriseus TaxID=1683161 RepID=UPI0015EFBD95|nr:MFS transporter [Chthonobacter albigriseus]